MKDALQSPFLYHEDGDPEMWENLKQGDEKVLLAALVFASGFVGVMEAVRIIYWPIERITQLVKQIKDR